MVRSPRSILTFEAAVVARRILAEMFRSLYSPPKASLATLCPEIQPGYPHTRFVPAIL
jgi:hypothetical protein